MVTKHRLVLAIAILASIVSSGLFAEESSMDGSCTILTIAGLGINGYDGDGGPATAALVGEPNDLVFDSEGNLYIAQEGGHVIRKISPDGIITTVAGTGTSGFSGDGGSAIVAQLHEPHGLAFDSEGDLYFADAGNNRVRKINVSGGIISTVAGNGTSGFSGDGGSATEAQLSNPRGIALDASGNLYIGDRLNGRVRKVATDGTITTFAGGAGSSSAIGDGGAATSAYINEVYGIAFGPDGSLYIAEDDGARIRKVSPDGIITTVAGNGTCSYPADSTHCNDATGDGGPAIEANVGNPKGVFVDPDGNLYIAEKRKQRIRKVTPDGIITTVAGTGEITESSWGILGPLGNFSGDGGPASEAALSIPQGVKIGPDGNLYIADTQNDRIRRVSCSGDTVPGGAGLAILGGTANEGTGTATVIVVMSGTSELPVTVSYATGTGTATAEVDYTPASGTLTWTPGETGPKTFSIPLINDAFFESGETLNVSISGATNATIGLSSGMIYISDDDPYPTLSVGNLTVYEGVGSAPVTVTLTGVSAGTVSVDCQSTTGMGGSATPDLDFTLITQTLTWNPGETGPKTCSIPVIDDLLFEGIPVDVDENVSIHLLNAVNAATGLFGEPASENWAWLSIRDNDPVPAFSISNTTVAEDAGNASLTVTMTGTSSFSHYVTYSTYGVSASMGSDFTYRGGTITWAAGETGPKTLTIPIINDAAAEPDETFNVNLSGGAGATITDPTGVITISTNDSTGGGSRFQIDPRRLRQLPQPRWRRPYP